MYAGKKEFKKARNKKVSYDYSIAKKVRNISEIKCKQVRKNLKKQGIKK
ncbi:hypothetical protein bthur0007_56790 [Bacillus thuringiensis serovar monterrey BGSC 4AJ1]|nr:hypothetical protein bthur0007_56790 [Bacillus thuringiensis serovar monterrey BGSC 4AJ1]